jgi:AcrR family transcriptional regulator
VRSADEPSLAVTAAARPSTPAIADRREALLATAAERFIKVGIRKTTMEDIARGAGAGKATLYRHFANKDEVIAALLDREVARLEREIAREVATSATASTRIEVALATTIAFFLNHPVLTRGRAEEPAELLERITSSGGPLVLRLQGTFEALVTDGIERGELRTVDAAMASEVLLRLATSYLAFPPLAVPVDDASQIRRLARAVVDTGLGPITS